MGIFVLPDVQPELEQGGAASSETPLIEEKEERPQPVTLPRFESLSPASSESVVGARLKICLARLHLEQEANEKQEAREAKERAQKRELEHKLAIRTLEIEAETKLKLRKLELENVATQTPTSSRHAPLSEHYDVRRHVALPQFRETEVDAYFNTFERLATALNWPKDIWTTLLQCKLIGKAQDAVATLSLADSLNYEVVKAAVLRAYELVPEVYRQKFRDYRKALAQSFVEFAREKGTLFDKWCAASKATDYSSLRELILLEEFKKCTPERASPPEGRTPPQEEETVLDADLWVLVPETHRAVLTPLSTDPTTSALLAPQGPPAQSIEVPAVHAPVPADLPSVQLSIPPVSMDYPVEDRLGTSEMTLRRSARPTAGQHSNVHHLPQAVGRATGAMNSQEPESNTLSTL
ncbi:hypothetical protein SKAU_G00341860 [Synaphobranchus kaupii]|uniref:SCAN box domain-containing protein n=1 Tax=Synaphobranchus kaupii TaxID=118154 RepID=A0A9Q1IIL8_SYNKA|nr:hypothetical protein SKAU_G00341860 [Synaphobranchus kaupii]